MQLQINKLSPICPQFVCQTTYTQYPIDSISMHSKANNQTITIKTTIIIIIREERIGDWP